MKASTCLEQLAELGEFRMSMGLERMDAWLDHFKRPDHSYSISLIAGTNGKGSTAKALQAILTEHGLKTGLVISPHIFTPLERISIDHKDISLDSFSEIYLHMQGLVNAGKLPQLSYFEVLTMLPALYFREQNVDHAVFEVGLGGRLDACNALRHGFVGLSHIDFDHMSYLGNTLEQIAREKAAIIHKDCQVASVMQWPQVEAVIKQQIQTSGARLLAIPTERSSQQNNEKLAIDLAQAILETVSPAKTDLSTTQTLTALKKAQLRCRFEVWNNSDRQQEVILDVAHNPRAILNLCQRVKQRYAEPPALLINMQADKDWHKCLQAVLNYTAHLYLCDNPSSRNWDLDEVGRYAQGLFSHVDVCSSTQEALRQALSTHNTLVCCGTFYIMAELIEFLQSHGFARAIAS